MLFKQKGNHVLLNDCWFVCSSIKPFTQQPYPIQPAVTTAISSETLPNYKTCNIFRYLDPNFLIQ